MQEIPRLARPKGALARNDGKGTYVRKGGYVYIAANRSRTLYIGVTNDLERRMFEHKCKAGSEFAAKYNITRLVYYEAFGDIRDAIVREKQLKRWRREKKVRLIECENPNWEDLSADWYGDIVIPSEALRSSAESRNLHSTYARDSSTRAPEGRTRSE